ncbi:hypothetical protein [Streptomyces avicenniae]|uniref:hypothetical protein n=1 Tax=Streptomyces avicenniae TaxID=500153 RepID=UPI000699A35C|nr:hypothetical protein [Streptomyces avicenniae]
MRLRARLAKTTAGLLTSLTLAAGLSGCVTVHGEEAVVPAATDEEARAALDRYVEISNEAKRVYDAEQNRTIESGGLGAIDFAGISARAEVSPEGDEDFDPLAVSDTRFHIPQQAGWPKFFVADTATNQGRNRWLMFFTRSGIDEDWRVSYLSSMPAADLPRFAEDEDGHLEDIPVGADDEGLVLPPAELSSAYSVYLQSGEGPFAEGPYTSETRAARDAVNNDPASLTEFRDEPAEDAEYAPLAMRTVDGDAFVMFTSLHDQRQTVAEGEEIEVNELTAALMEGEARTSLTLDMVAIQAALVPAGEGRIQLLTQMKDAVAITGE